MKPSGQQLWIVKKTVRQSWVQSQHTPDIVESSECTACLAHFQHCFVCHQKYFLGLLKY
jgi:hypothetical protein